MMSMVMRQSFPFYGRTSAWARRRFLVMTSFTDTSLHTQPAEVWCTRQSQLCLKIGHIRCVRFYSPDSIDSVEEKELLLPALEDWSLPDVTPVRQRKTSSPLMDRLQGCCSPSEVLDLIRQHAPSDREFSACLMRMWFTTKKMSDVQKSYELELMFKDYMFDSLLYQSMVCVGNMCGKDVTYSLQAMLKLGVPQQSRVVQMFLRACQEKLNELDEISLSILASCLMNMESCTNVAALKEGMSLVIGARLPQIKHVKSLRVMMQMLGKDAPFDLKRKLEKKVLSMAKHFTPLTASYMINTMATGNYNYKPLLHLWSMKIAGDLHVLSFSRLIQVLHACRKLNYRNMDFFTSISDYITSTMDIWTKKQRLLFLFVFESLQFCHAPLMETFAKKVIDDPNALTLQDLLLVLKVFSSLNPDLLQHRQQFLDSITLVLDSYLPTISQYTLLCAVHGLCQLGHFPHTALMQLLQESTMEHFDTTSSKVLQGQNRMFQTLNLCLRLDRPHLPHPLTVPLSLLGDFTPSFPPLAEWLSQSLKKLVNDQPETQLQEMVVVENFYVIDGVITKPLLNKMTEDSVCEGVTSSPAESSERIAVILAPPSSFCFGTSNPRGFLALKIRHLRILGYKTVLVKENKLQFSSEEKRMDFLRRHIFPEIYMPDEQHSTEQLQM